jgi:hypothetical protein
MATREHDPGDVQHDYVWVVATVNQRKNSYKLRVRQPTNLAQNQFAYRLRIAFDRKDWLDRIREVELPLVEPPGLPKPRIMELNVEKSTPQRVMEDLKGGG